jgi:Spy/CpxP family protein refolding chaperone
MKGERGCAARNIKTLTTGTCMKLINRIFTLGAVAVTLALGTSSLLAQDNGGGPGGQGGGGGGGRRGNWDPAQFQQRIMDNVRDQLNFTNDTDWSAVQPLVQKVLDARRDIGFGNMGRLLRGNRGGGDNNRRGGMFGQTSPEEDALQKAIDEDAPAAQIKDLLAKYQAAQKAKQDKLLQAQADFRAVLTTKQEAQATLLGLLN